MITDHVECPHHHTVPTGAFDILRTSSRTGFELGAHPKAIQERLGHSSITVTMDVYGHLFPALNEALTERLDEVFRSAREAPATSRLGAVVALPEL